tara:strand:- start:47 stop:1078 length:1032 start_codon:yes stop_codon:yes gene_type:complete
MIKKFIKKIGKGIRTGLKSIGKAFKKAFKGIGKFIGKLGPIGMLGMMLIMPQMASWWGSFGNWAGTLGKGFGSVMRGIHKAGTMVGKAYSTVTDTISGTMNKITGGSFARPGGEGMFAGEYVEGASDKLANWMSGQVDKGREFLGLETATPATDIATDVATELPEGMKEIPSAYTEDLTQTYSSTDQPIIDQMKTLESKGLSTTADSLSNQLSSEGLEMYKTYGTEGFVDDFAGAPGKIVEAGENLSERIMQGIKGPESNFIKSAYKTGKKLYTTGSTLQDAAQRLGLTQEEYVEQYGGGFVADIAVDTHLSAQDDWLQNGYVGNPSFGIGSPEYFNSIFMRA